MVEVLYKASDPAIARVHVFFELWLGSLALGAFGLLCLGVGLGTWFHDGTRLKTKGETQRKQQESRLLLLTLIGIMATCLVLLVWHRKAERLLPACTDHVGCTGPKARKQQGRAITARPANAQFHQGERHRSARCEHAGRH